MEEAIREGNLRLLASEKSSDVTLSCNGTKLLAHKIILSIASPVLQDLLLLDTSEAAVLIFPDISANTMSLILDYIYTGSVTISSNTLLDFITVAGLLKLHLDFDSVEKYLGNCSNQHSESRSIKKFFKRKNDENDSVNCLQSQCKKLLPYPQTDNVSIDSNILTECHSDNLQSQHERLLNLSLTVDDCEEVVHKKALRKIPNLMPISSLHASAFKTRKGLYNRVFPSPWCPRLAPILADPRLDCSSVSGYSVLREEKVVEENDSNNNFRIASPHSADLFNSPKNYSTSNLYSSAFSPENLKKSATSENIPSIKTSPNASYCVVNTSSSFYEKSKIKESDTEKPHSPVDSEAKSSIGRLLTSPDLKIENDNNEDDIISVKSPGDLKADDLKDEQKTNKKPFKCEDCGKCFSQLRNFKYHRSIHEGTKEFAARCLECGKVFNDRGYLSSHMKIHRDRKEYACPHCPKRFNQRVAYNMHLRIHTGIKPHECPTCGKSFSRKMLLKQHQRVHTGERPYTCPECGKSFADRSNMSLHARLHTGVKPYACNLCPKSFTKKHHLKTHMNFHTGLKPYSCQKCGLSFSQSSNMRTHYKKCILKPSSSPVDRQNI